MKTGYDPIAFRMGPALSARPAMRPPAHAAPTPGIPGRVQGWISEIVAAHHYLLEALAPDGRPNTFGAKLIDTEREAAALDEEDQLWLGNYLADGTSQQRVAYTGISLLRRALEGTNRRSRHLQRAA